MRPTIAIPADLPVDTLLEEVHKYGVCLDEVADVER
jgi:hypothetical protein